MERLKKCLTLSLISIFLSGCETANRGHHCDGWRPIRMTDAEVNGIPDEVIKQADGTIIVVRYIPISRGTKEQIAEHLKHGEETCGWKE